jgi:SOS-response transcriptional repressor LexA
MNRNDRGHSADSAGPRDEAAVSHAPRFDGVDEELARVVGAAVARDPASALWRDARFLDWIAAEARLHDARSRRWSDARVLAAGEAALLRAHARRLRLTRTAVHPTRRPAAVIGTPAAVIGAAAAARSAPMVSLGVAAGTGRDLWDELVDEWLPLPDETPRGRYVAVGIAGDSMQPLMHTGDTVLVRLGVPVRASTVVVARHPESGYVCKVVRRIERSSIVLGSLEPTRPDITIPRDGDHVLGTVVQLWCHHGDSSGA